jgi:hypothetical protein
MGDNLIMLKLTKQQEETLIKYLPNYKEYGHINDLLDKLDEVMLGTLDGNDESTSGTSVIIKLYDSIYSQNL